MAWEDWAAGDKDVLAVRVRPDGTVLDPYGIPVAPTVGEQEKPQVAFGAGQYLVVWQGGLTDSGGVCARRVTEWGGVLDPAGIPIATSGQWTSPVVTFSNPNYMAVWEDRRNGGVDLYGARIAGDGTVLDPAGFLVSEVGSVSSLSDVISPWSGRATVVYSRLDGPSRAFLRFIDEGQPPVPQASFCWMSALAAAPAAATTAASATSATAAAAVVASSFEMSRTKGDRAAPHVHATASPCAALPCRTNSPGSLSTQLARPRGCAGQAPGSMGEARNEDPPHLRSPLAVSRGLRSRQSFR